MLKTTEEVNVPSTPDGTLTGHTNNRIIVMQIFFNHDSKETFEDKLLRIILAGDIAVS